MKKQQRHLIKIFKYSRVKFQADDGLFSTICHVNITIRDVNNHSPQFARDHYMTSIAENSPIGKLCIFFN